MEFYRRSSVKPKSIGILAGSFNPPTVAHLELARAARGRVDEILCVVPRVFPHKEYFGATLEQRMRMLDVAGLPQPYSIAETEGGLFMDIARACRPHYDSETKLYFVCGRDAAERILTWDYGEPGVAQRMLRDFELLVAPRDGRLCPPDEIQHRVHELIIRGEQDEVSSTEVRARIARGERWEHWVPEEIVERVREIYS